MTTKIGRMGWLAAIPPRRFLTTMARAQVEIEYWQYSSRSG
jgi:hypothetical protein